MTKKEQRIKKLTEYLQRLGAGEELEEVRKDYAGGRDEKASVF